MEDNFDDDVTIATPSRGVTKAKADPDATTPAPVSVSGPAAEQSGKESGKDSKLSAGEPEPGSGSLPPMAPPPYPPATIWTPDTNLLRGHRLTTTTVPRQRGRPLVTTLVIALVVVAAVIGASTAFMLVR